MRTLTRPAPVTLREFDEIFEAVKNWGRWGPEDELGTLNYITPDTVRAAAALVRSGRQVTMSIPMNKVAGPDNPSPVTHHVVQGHDIDIGSSTLTFATDYLGLAFHGDCHTHMDALCHIAYKGQVYNGRPGGPARRAQIPRRRLARARRGGDARGTGGGRAGAGCPAGRGRHPAVPDRAPPAAARARGLEQRLPAGWRRQGRPAR